MMNQTFGPLEETLNGGYRGLYGEVVTCDIYRLRSLPFEPDVIFDIGGNVGVFTRFAAQLFPQAERIVAVEPDPHNIAIFKHHTTDPRVVLLERALGHGPIYHGLTAVNGSGETYLSVGLGYSKFQTGATIELSNVPAISLSEVFHPYWRPGMKTLIKIDCEGAENCLWHDAASMAILKMADYLCMELHSFAVNAEERDEVIRQTDMALKVLESTHHCEREHVHFWALKK